MQAVTAGEVDVIVAWDPDRLHRSPAELEDFIAAVERAGVGVVTVQAGEGGLSPAAGELVARVVGSLPPPQSHPKAGRGRGGFETKTPPRPPAGAGGLRRG